MEKTKTDPKRFWCKKRKALVNRNTLGCQDKDCIKDCPDKPTLELTPKQKLEMKKVKAVSRKKPSLKNTLHKSKTSLEILNHIKTLRSYPDTYHELLDCLIGHAEKGANLKVLNKAFFSVSDRWYEKTETFNLLMDLKKNRINYLKKEKVINNALRTLLKLKPVFSGFSISQQVNKEIQEMQTKLEEYQPLIERYLDLILIEECIDPLGKGLGNFYDKYIKHVKGEIDEYYNKNYLETGLQALMDTYPPDKIKKLLKIKPAKQTTHDIWSKAIVLLVNEFKRIYKTDKTAYKETAKLLHLMYPEVFKDTDPDRVRQRYQSKK